MRDQNRYILGVSQPFSTKLNLALNKRTESLLGFSYLIQDESYRISVRFVQRKHRTLNDFGLRF